MNRIYNFGGFLIGKILRYRSAVVTQNLARSFPLSDYKELSLQHQRFYRNMCRLMVELLLPSRPELILSADLYRTLHQQYRADRQIILLLGHYGNWEILGKLPLQLGLPIQSLYKPQKNRWVDRFLQRRRGQYGLRLLPSQQAAKILLDQTGHPSITLFIADQFPGQANGLAIDFLQQPSYMFMGPERIAKRLDAYVAYIELQAIGNHKWKANLQPICLRATDSPDGHITTSYTRKLEKSIQQDPSWWLWSHKRWK
ncbi:lysophospholipid acyltransferase family protein [Sphingobacterium tabacisoli]|uniref:Lysophospholipid acyltransferase family protein n=1 Tax=Sphingobacterium tabacisoli TaxID=2044855 RepID=A0ABW5L6N6_9SPHI|nr:lysophospholipid acyltransferase family protein [Sphingobacterium tabacisoli]